MWNIPNGIKLIHKKSRLKKLMEKFVCELLPKHRFRLYDAD